MYSNVFTLKGTEQPGTFAEPYAICRASTTTTSARKKELGAFFVSDVTKQRIVKVERVERLSHQDDGRSKRTSAARNQESEWTCTVVPSNDRLLYMPRGLCAVPHAAQQGRHNTAKNELDVIIVIDSGHNRIRALSVDANLHHSDVRTESPFLNIAGSGLKGAKDDSGYHATFNAPHSACFLQDGSLLVTDTRNHRIRRLAPDQAKLALADQQRAKLDGGGGDDDESAAAATIQFSPTAASRRQRRVPTSKKRAAANAANAANATKEKKKKLSLAAMLLQWSTGERKDHNHRPRN